MAEERITEKDVYEMLTIPSYDMWPMGVVFPAPGQGLFLTGVEYEEPVLEDPDNGIEKGKLDIKDKNLDTMQA